MKLLILFSLLISTAIWAKDVDLSSFNKEIQKNYAEVLDENPQIYENKGPSRAPASIEPEPSNKERTEKLDQFDEQTIGPNEL